MDPFGKENEQNEKKNVFLADCCLVKSWATKSDPK